MEKWWHYCLIKTDNIELIKLISKELLTIENILQIDDIELLTNIEKNDCLSYFKKGKTNIKNFIIEKYPDMITEEYFVNAAYNCDLEMLKKLTKLYSGKSIDWNELTFIYISYAKDKNLDDFYQFVSDKNVDMKKVLTISLNKKKNKFELLLDD